MTNALDYLDWRGDLSFERSPFCEVDLFILSQICSLNFEGIVPGDAEEIPLKEAAEKYFALHGSATDSLGVLQSPYVLPMLKKLPETMRFADLRLCFAYKNVDFGKVEQCTALTILAPDGTVNVVFRGTDDTLIGWKEDFNMATKSVVPAQKDAQAYLRRVALAKKGKIRICGHSKGGNLAVYAAASVPKRIRNRILSVCSFDGPGFRPEFFETRGYRDILDRTMLIRSQNALVGTLLEAPGTEVTVHSNKQGPLAHDGFSWEVKGTAFVREKGLSDTSLRFKQAMDETLSSMSDAEKQAFVDELFNTLMSGGADTVRDLKDSNIRALREVAKSFRDDTRVHRFALAVLEQFLRSYRDELKESISSIKFTK